MRGRRAWCHGAWCSCCTARCRPSPPSPPPATPPPRPHRPPSLSTQISPPHPLSLRSFCRKCCARRAATSLCRPPSCLRRRGPLARRLVLSTAYRSQLARHIAFSLLFLSGFTNSLGLGVCVIFSLLLSCTFISLSN